MALQLGIRIDINLMLTRLQLYICNDSTTIKSRNVLYESGFRCYSRDLPCIITHLASYSDVLSGYYSNRLRITTHAAVLGIITLTSENVKNRRRATASWRRYCRYATMNDFRQVFEVDS
jgi:hypothetical protein